jgi:hypothetical protein
VRIGISLIPTSVARRPALPSFLQALTATTTTTTRMYQKPVPADLRLCGATASPFVWLLRATLLSTQMRRTSDECGPTRGSARTVLPPCAAQGMRTCSRACAAASQPPIERGNRPCQLPTGACSLNDPSISTVDDSGEHVYQGIDLNYIIGGLAGPGSRRSSHSFVAPQSLPLPPTKDKAKSKDKDKRKKDKSKGKEPLDVTTVQGLIGLPTASPKLLDVAPWADADEITGVRRPSTWTLDDSFAGGLRRLDPDYAERRNEWSFIRERDQVVLPSRDPDGSPRTWDVWRCAQIGKIRLERAILPPCMFSFVLSS